jgi:hypothetical protein
MAVKIIVSVDQSCTAFRTILDFSERHPYDDGSPVLIAELGRLYNRNLYESESQSSVCFREQA